MASAVKMCLQLPQRTRRVRRASSASRAWPHEGHAIRADMIDSRRMKLHGQKTLRMQKKKERRTQDCSSNPGQGALPNSARPGAPLRGAVQALLR